MKSKQIIFFSFAIYFIVFLLIMIIIIAENEKHEMICLGKWLKMMEANHHWHFCIIFLAIPLSLSLATRFSFFVIFKKRREKMCDNLTLKKPCIPKAARWIRKSESNLEKSSQRGKREREGESVNDDLLPTSRYDLLSINNDLDVISNRTSI